ncbi:hypothetical protein [Halococcus saccharolyticus]|uniref:hypothetical protein n=1 Tax=Halococcus saccharolyticus TaxID=62319 RepID=UPI000AE7BCFF|nr:hypothetical protein [Halococcus saccharolyticus]
MVDNHSLAVGQGLFLGGVISAVVWVIGYAAIAFFDVDLWLVGPALGLLLLGTLGLLVHSVAASADALTAEELE